jgi:undecaprenyl-diphosphatase
MNLFETLIIAIVEGLTEFLPVSSTGHMIITQHLLGVESSPFVKAFIVNIQFGAILSVLVLYFKRFFQTLGFYYKLFVAFLPAAIVGFLLGDYIDRLLESVWIVALMLLAGGVFMLFVDKWFNKTSGNQHVTYPTAFKIGLFQCIAMIPGVSRSMATIVGGMSQKLTRKNAAEFSFFLAVPTMFAASAYKLLDDHTILFENHYIYTLIIGNIISFIVALFAMKFFIRFLTKYGFKLFGYYRIAIGVILLILLTTGVNLQIG